MLKLKMKKMEEKKLEINLNKQPTFQELWYEGSVEYEGTFHRFWLVCPMGKDDFEPEVKWFFKSVPKEVRAMYKEIINMYLEKNNL